MALLRGDIYYIEPYYSTGSEQRAGRPAVIVSNNKNNEHSNTMEVVYLTTRPKTDLPTHVTIRGTGRESIALCEQVDTVDISRFGEYCGKCTDSELANLEIALMISLDLTSGVKEKVVEVEKEVFVEKIVEVPAAGNNEEVAELQKKLTVAHAQLEIVQAMYQDLLSKTMK